MLAAVGIQAEHEYGVALACAAVSGLSLSFSVFYWKGNPDSIWLTRIGRILGLLGAAALLLFGSLWVLGQKGDQPWSRIPGYVKEISSNGKHPQNPVQPTVPQVTEKPTGGGGVPGSTSSGKAPRKHEDNNPAPKAPESSIQYLGVSLGSSKPDGSIPDLKLNYRVGPNSVYHVKTWSGLVVVPSTMFFTVNSKFYRAFQSQIAKNPNPPETPEIGSGEISIKPGMMASYSSPTPSRVVYVFSHISWLDKVGIAGDTTQCLVTPDSSKIDAQTEWGLCQLPPTTTVELKYESMTSTQLLDVAAGISSTLRHSTDIENLCDEVERQWPPKGTLAAQNEEERRKAFDENTKSIEDCFAQKDVRIRGIVCPEVAPLVEEMMFRIGYSPSFLLQWHDAEQSGYHPFDPKAPPIGRMHEESMLGATLIGCQTARGYTPSLKDTADSLDMLTTALREAVKHKFSAPFDSRPLE
jgi:hypothetical protein